MVCRTLLSKTVKSCCCRPATGGPDLGVTTTSSWILVPGGRGGEVVCCAKSAAVHSREARSKPLAEFEKVGIRSLREMRSDQKHFACRGRRAKARLSRSSVTLIAQLTLLP